MSASKQSQDETAVPWAEKMMLMGREDARNM